MIEHFAAITIGLALGTVLPVALLLRESARCYARAYQEFTTRAGTPAATTRTQG